MFIPYNFTWDSANPHNPGYQVDGLVNLDEVKATKHTKDIDGETWEIVFGETQTIEVDQATFDMIQKQLLANGNNNAG